MSMIYFLGGKLVILYTLGLFTWTVNRKSPMCSKWKGGVIFYTVIKCFTCIRHYFCSMILSTRHTDDINLPYLDHVARRPPLIRHFTTLSSQRDREMRDVYFEKRWASHQEFCGLSTVSVFSYVIYFNAQEELNFFIYLLHHKGFFVYHFVIFFFTYNEG